MSMLYSSLAIAVLSVTALCLIAIIFERRAIKRLAKLDRQLLKT